MDGARLNYLFHRYVNRRCTEAERNEFLDIVRDARAEDQLKSLLDGLWFEASPVSMDSGNAYSILNKILQEENEIKTLQRSRYHYPIGKIAASLAIIFVSAVAALYYVAGDHRSVSEEHVTAFDLNQPGFIKLPDGSTVILNGSSKLEFPQSFATDVREVTLTGEGYFDITQDTERPFIVHTGKVKTTVLGTAFNIRAYPDQSDITVTVTRGKVRVSDDTQIFGILNPDQQITFDKNRDVINQKDVDSHQVTAWIEKDIYFDDTTIIQAIDQLEKRFGINITLRNSGISDCRFTATFVKGEDVAQILRILCDFNNATLVVKGINDFEIQGGECPQ